MPVRSSEDHKLILDSKHGLVVIPKDFVNGAISSYIRSIPKPRKDTKLKY